MKEDTVKGTMVNLLILKFTKMNNLIKCPYSGEMFKPKRSNQKFASKQNRLSFYNKQYKEKRQPLRAINQKLFRNYSILEIALDNTSEVLVSNDYLRVRGFDFTYITHFTKDNDHRYFCLYDIAFRKIPDNQTQIIKNEANTDI